MKTSVTQRRLNDGAGAMALQELPADATEAAMEARLSELGSAIAAMQSLDDLGSEEANQRAWDDMNELLRRYKELEQQLKERQGRSTR